MIVISFFTKNISVSTSFVYYSIQHSFSSCLAFPVALFLLLFIAVVFLCTFILPTAFSNVFLWLWRYFLQLLTSYCWRLCRSL